MKELRIESLPVVDNDRLIGRLELIDIVGKRRGTVSRYCKRHSGYVGMDESADKAVELMGSLNTVWAPVQHNRKYMGCAMLDDILKKYEARLDNGNAKR